MLVSGVLLALCAAATPAETQKTGPVEDPPSLHCLGFYWDLASPRAEVLVVEEQVINAGPVPDPGVVGDVVVLVIDSGEIFVERISVAVVVVQLRHQIGRFGGGIATGASRGVGGVVTAAGGKQQ